VQVNRDVAVDEHPADDPSALVAKDVVFQVSRKSALSAIGIAVCQVKLGFVPFSGVAETWQTRHVAFDANLVWR
jgi:hypothetical protein